jgi:hypothetical protein
MTGSNHRLITAVIPRGGTPYAIVDSRGQWWNPGVSCGEIAQP